MDDCYYDDGITMIRNGENLISFESMIYTLNGYKRLSDIKIGDKVYCCDVNNNNKICVDEVISMRCMNVMQLKTKVV